MSRRQSVTATTMKITLHAVAISKYDTNNDKNPSTYSVFFFSNLVLRCDVIATAINNENNKIIGTTVSSYSIFCKAISLALDILQSHLTGASK